MKLTSNQIFLLTPFVISVFFVFFALAWFSGHSIFYFNMQDPTVHLQALTSILAGNSFPFSYLVFYADFYASVLLVHLFGPNLITSMTLVLMFLLAASPFTIYYFVKSITKHESYASLTTIVYAISYPLWFGSLFIYGLYPNFFGLLFSFVTLTATVNLYNSFSKNNLLIFTLAFAGFLFGHYTDITIIPAIVFIILLKNRKLGIAITGISTIFISLALTYPLLQGMLSVLWTNSPLSGAVTVFYFIISDTLIMPVLSTFIIPFIFLATRNKLLIAPLLWFLTLVIISPNNAFTWRYAFEASFPFIIMCSISLCYLLKTVSRYFILPQGTIQIK